MVRQHEEVGGNDLETTHPLGGDTHYLMSLVRAHHFLGESIQHRGTDWRTEVYYKVIVEALARIGGNLLEVLRCWFNEVYHWQIWDSFTLLCDVQMKYDITVSQTSDLHNWRDDLEPSLI